MKTRSKLLLPLLLLLVVTVLFGCGGAADQQGPGGDTSTNPTAVTTGEEPATDDTTAEEPATDDTTAAEGDAVTIRYANWNLGTEEENNLQRQMVQAYLDTHPNVTVE